MDQRDGNPLLVKRPTHVAVHCNDADAADGSGAGQNDAVGLGGQRIGGRQGVVGDEGLHGFDLPGRPDAVGEVKGPGHFTTEAIDVERNAADGGVCQRCLQLCRDPLIGGQPRRLPDPGAAMHQRPRDLDHGNAVDDREGLATAPRLAAGEIIAEERGAGGERGCLLILGRDLQPLDADVPPDDPGSEAYEEGQRLGGIDHEGRVEDALGDLGVMHHPSSAGRGSRSSPSSS